MIILIEAKNFRSLKFIHQPLNKFHVLIGANASGKTTFLDVISFLSDLLNDGIDYAIHQRTSNFNDLTFSSKGGDIEIAIEAELPLDIINKLGNKSLDIIRYEIRFGLDTETKEHAIKEERIILINQDSIISGGTIIFMMKHTRNQEMGGCHHLNLALKNLLWETFLLMKQNFLHQHG